MNELKTRGVGDILIAVVDGLTGFPDAIAAVFPETAVQTCIVHLIRNSLAFVSWKDRKAVMPDLKAIYRAETAEAALARLDAFEAGWRWDANALPPHGSGVLSASRLPPARYWPAPRPSRRHAAAGPGHPTITPVCRSPWPRFAPRRGGV